MSEFDETYGVGGQRVKLKIILKITFAFNCIWAGDGFNHATCFFIYNLFWGIAGLRTFVVFNKITGATFVVDDVKIAHLTEGMLPRQPVSQNTSNEKNCVKFVISVFQIIIT